MNRVQPDTTTTIPIIKAIYTAIITQEGTAAPTVLELQNTLGGPITWERLFAGIYQGTLPEGVPDPTKTTYNISQGVSGNVAYAYTYIGPPNSILIETQFGGAGSDDALLNNTLEIKIYN